MRYREIRFPAETGLRVIVGDETRSAQLLNVSATGARLGQLGGVPRDSIVTLAYLHHRLSARVVWTVGTITGVMFLVPLGKSGVNALRREGSRTNGFGPSFHHWH